MPESKAKRAARDKRYYERKRKRSVSRTCSQCGLDDSKKFKYQGKTLCAVCFAHNTMQKGLVALSRVVADRRSLFRNILRAEDAEERHDRSLEDGRPDSYGLDSNVRLVLAVSRSETTETVSMGLDGESVVKTRMLIQDAISGLRERERLIVGKIDDFTTFSFEDVRRLLNATDVKPR